MDLSGIIKESQLEKSIKIPSKTGQREFINGLKYWSVNPAEIQHRSNKFKSFRNIINKNPLLSKKLDVFFKEYVEAEETIEMLKNPPTAETKESKSQLVFTHPDLKPLNFAPFLLLILYAMKVFITPIFALLMPVILIAAPYFLIKYVYRMNIEFSHYLSIIQEMVIKKSATMMEKLQLLGHIGWVAVGICQNM